LWAALIAVGVWSCKGGSAKVDFVQIPKDAAFVLSIDFKSLTTKGEGWKELLNENTKDLLSLDKSSDKLITNLTKTGIDFDSKAVVFGKMSKKEEENYVVAAFKIKSEADFEKALKEGDDKAEVKSEGAIKYTYDKRNTLVAWEKGIALVIAKDKKTEEKVLLDQYKAIKATQAKDGLAQNNKEFATFSQQEKDILAWVNVESLAVIDEETAKNVKNFKSYELAFNFENGQLVGDFVLKTIDNPPANLKNLYRTGVNSKLSGSVALDSPTMLFSAALGMKELHELVKESGSLKDRDAEGIQKDLDMTTLELFEMLSGDIILAIKDAKINSAMKGDVEPEAVIALGIGKKELADKFLAALVKRKVIKKEDDNTYEVAGVEPADVTLVVKNDALFFTSNGALKDNIEKGGKGLDANFSKLTSGNATVFFLSKDLLKQLEMFSGLLGSAALKDFFSHAVPELESLTVTSLPFKNNRFEAKMVLQMTNKNQNALATMVQIAKKFSKKPA